MKVNTSSNTTVQKGTLGKTNCCVCGKEVGLMGRYQMADFNEICKACAKQASGFFIPAEATLEMYKGDQAQMADSQKLYEAYFAKGGKHVKKFGLWYSSEKILIDEEHGLICVTKKKNGKRTYLVYRLADLEKYSEFKKKIKGADGKEATNTYCYLQFHRAIGVSEVYISIAGKYKKLQKYLKKSMGMSGIKGMKNAIAKAKEDIASAKAVASATKTAFANAEDEAAAKAAAEKVMIEADKAFYNGREALVEKADAAIAAVIKNV